jgi:hypothetical protein
MAQRINHYARQPEALRQMGTRSRKFGHVDAAAAIVDDCYELVGLV